MLAKTLLRCAAAAATGTMFFLSVPNWNLWWLEWVAFVPLLWAIHDATPRRAAWLGFLAGLVANAGGFYWITGLLMRFAHLPAIVSGFLWLLLAAYQAVAFTATAWACAYVRSSGARVPLALVVAAAATAFDFLVPQLFPFYLGVGQAWNLPIIQVAELTGPVGVTFLLALSSAAVWELISRRAIAPALTAAVCITAALGFGITRISTIEAARARAPKRKIGMVQANVGIRQKGDPADAAREHSLHLELSRELEKQGADLIVWSESSYPYFFWRDQKEDWPAENRRRVMQNLHTPVFFGTLTYPRGRGRSYNSALLARPDGTLDGPYDKIFLLLFGEYVPLYDELQIEKWIPAASNFARGKELRIFENHGMRIGPMICFEDILPSFGRKLVALRPNVFVNITNDAWFGATNEPWGHLALSVFRSVEHRVDLVRAVNTGVTAHVDATGRVVRKTRSVDPALEPDAPAMTLLADVALLDPTGWYGRLGDTFGYLNVLGLGALLVAARRKHVKRRKG